MLTRAENELLCRVGVGTPMGELMRQYWLPIVYEWELEPDGQPQRVRLLGDAAQHDSRIAHLLVGVQAEASQPVEGEGGVEVRRQPAGLIAQVLSMNARRQQGLVHLYKRLIAGPPTAVFERPHIPTVSATPVSA